MNNKQGNGLSEGGEEVETSSVSVVRGRFFDVDGCSDRLSLLVDLADCSDRLSLFVELAG